MERNNECTTNIDDDPANHACGQCRQSLLYVHMYVKPVFILLVNIFISVLVIVLANFVVAVVVIILKTAVIVM